MSDATLLQVPDVSLDAMATVAPPLPATVSDAQSIQAVEDALVNLLDKRPALAQYHVEAWPEDAGNYKLRSPFGALLVSYKGSKFGKTISTDGTAQEWTLTFEVVTFSRNLRTHVGAYAVMDEIRRAVSGWWAPGAINNAYPTKEGFVGEEDGVWSFATYIEVPSISVQEGNTDETDIPLVDPSTIPPTGGGSSPGTIPSLKSVTSYLENL